MTSNIWKFRIPKNAKNDLVRMRVVNELNQGSTRKLTLLTAPVGFGKTTAIRQWADNSGMKHAYFAIDALDNDPALFFKNLVTALQSIQKGLGKGVFESLQSAKTVSMEAAIEQLCNQIGMVLQDHVIILDDFHLINSDAVHGIVALLIGYLPPQSKMMIAAEKDPPFALAEMRSAGQLKEIHPPHLSFTMDEAEAFLKVAMDLKVAYGDASALVVRTKAKPAPLKYAGLCLRHYPSLSEFVSEFEKEERDESEFLIDILLKNQTAEIAKTVPMLTIADAFNAALAAQISEQNDCGWLQDFAENGDFVTDCGDGWFRLHPFLDNVFAKITAIENSGDAHTRAALWFEQNNQPHNAIAQALDGNNFHFAGQLIGNHAMEMLQNGELLSVVGWLNALPASLDQLLPMLSVCRAWVKIVRQDFSDIEPLLAQAIAAKMHAAAPSEITEHVTAIREYLADKK